MMTNLVLDVLVVLTPILQNLCSKKILSGLGLEIIVKGLKGGHSGMDIHLKRGNANKIMNRLLNVALDFNLSISEINGGSLRNAIPRESFPKLW